MSGIHNITDRERELTFENTMLHKMAAEHKVERDALAAENERLREAARMGLEALNVATTPLAKDRQEVLRAITALKEALGAK